MRRRPPRSTRTDTLFPYATLFRSGVGRVLFFNKHDGALSDFNIRDSWAPTGQLGVRYELNKSWMLNADVRYVPFSTHASGSLGGAPALTRLDIDPILTSVGVTLRFISEWRRVGTEGVSTCSVGWCTL